jgi:hypothetical protein
VIVSTALFTTNICVNGANIITSDLRVMYLEKTQIFNLSKAKYKDELLQEKKSTNVAK